MSTTAANPRPHAHAPGPARFTLADFPEEGVFTVKETTGHNFINGEPCYTLADENGDEINRIIESKLVPHNP